MCRAVEAILINKVESSIRTIRLDLEGFAHQRTVGLWQEFDADLAAIVQLAEHVVQQHHRVFARDGGSCGGFGHFQAEHDAPLLSLTRIHFCRLTIQKKV